MFRKQFSRVKAIVEYMFVSGSHINSDKTLNDILPGFTST